MNNLSKFDLEGQKEQYDYALEFIFGELKTASNIKRFAFY